MRTMPESQRAWFVNEDLGVYEHDAATQAADFPNDYHTPYPTQEAAEYFASIMESGINDDSLVKVTSEAERLLNYWERHGDNPEAVTKWAVSDLLGFVRLVKESVNG